MEPWSGARVIFGVLSFKLFWLSYRLVNMHNIHPRANIHPGCTFAPGVHFGHVNVVL